MRLSEAIALGRVLITKTEPHSFCGCALAMGLAGVGKEPCPADIENVLARVEANAASALWHAAEIAEWPWIRDDQPVPYRLLGYSFEGENTMAARDIISDLFFEVDRKAISLDQLIDWVRSVEPAEPALPSAEDLDAVAQEQCMAEQTS